jgi:hypothetical protein
MLHLEKLAKVCISVNWEDLVVERNPAKEETVSYDYFGSDWEYPYQKINKPTVSRKWFVDTQFDRFIALVEVNSENKVTKYDVSPKRKELEKKAIDDFLNSLDLGIKKSFWDGITLTCEHKTEYGGHITEVRREELEDYVGELKEWRKFTKNNFN